jgi:hypothetical protein
MTPGSWEYLLAGHGIEERAGEANALGKKFNDAKSISPPSRIVVSIRQLTSLWTGGT